MAWEEFEAFGTRGATGDKALDAMAVGLRKLTEAYEDRYGRKPSAVEVVHAFSSALRGSAARFVADPDALAGLKIDYQPPPEGGPRADPADYEASYAPRPADVHVVTRRKDGVDVLRIPLLKAANGKLRVFYEVLDPSLTDEDARVVIRQTVLADLYGDELKQKASSIQFLNAKTSVKKAVPYT